MKRCLLVVPLVLLTASCQAERGTRQSGEGSTAPGFTLPSVQGEAVSLADYRGDRPVLLYFSMGPG